MVVQFNRTLDITNYFGQINNRQSFNNLHQRTFNIFSKSGSVKGARRVTINYLAAKEDRNKIMQNNNNKEITKH